MKKVYEEPIISIEKYEIDENINDTLSSFNRGPGENWEIPTDETTVN